MQDDSPTPNEPREPEPPADQATWPRRQVYFVTVEWLDDPHRPASTEHLARAIRHTLEHGHNVEPDAAPARFVVRVKAGDLASELEGKIKHRHHH